MRIGVSLRNENWKKKNCKLLIHLDWKISSSVNHGGVRTVFQFQWFYVPVIKIFLQKFLILSFLISGRSDVNVSANRGMIFQAYGNLEIFPAFSARKRFVRVVPLHVLSQVLREVKFFGANFADSQTGRFVDFSVSLETLFATKLLVANLIRNERF